MNITSAISFAFDGEDFWPPQLRAEGRKHIQEYGTEEQKELLGRLPDPEAQRPRMNATLQSNSRMGSMR